MKPDVILAICAVATVAGGAFIFVVNLMLAPIRSMIEHMGETRGMVNDHADKIENHEVRIVKIETVHEVEGK